MMTVWARHQFKKLLSSVVCWPSQHQFKPSEVTRLIFRSCTTLEALWLTGVDWPRARADIGAAIRSELFLTSICEFSHAFSDGVSVFFSWTCLLYIAVVDVELCLINAWIYSDTLYKFD